MYVMYKDDEDNSLTVNSVIRMSYDESLFDGPNEEGLFIIIATNTGDYGIGTDCINVLGITMEECDRIVSKAYSEGKIDLSKYEVLMDSGSLKGTANFNSIIEHNRKVVSDTFSNLRGLV